MRVKGGGNALASRLKLVLNNVPPDHAAIRHVMFPFISRIAYCALYCRGKSEAEGTKGANAPPINTELNSR